MKKEINSLLNCGGGIRCVTFIGIFKKLEELIKEKAKNPENENIPIIDIRMVAGVSAGSIFGLIYILGYTAHEMEEEILHKKLDQLKDIRFLNFLNKYGLDSGNNIMLWLESLMVKKDIPGDITFEELFEKTKKDFRVYAANLNKYSFTEFNYQTTPKLKVLDGIRMSIGIPFMFTINKFDVKKGIVCEKGDIHVDGGLIDSYPISLFKDSLENLVGFKLVSNGECDEHDVNEKIDDIESYIYHVLACFMVQRDRKTTMNKEYKDHTIYIDTQGITQTVNFGLSALDKKKLIEIGYQTASKFFA